MGEIETAASRYAGDVPSTLWLRGLRVQMRVIGALLIRDALSRHGHGGLGFFWVVAEPLLLTTAIMVLWTMSNMTHGSDVGVIPFALTGYSFITLWRHIVAKSVRVMTQSASLIYHRQVKFLDVMVARALLETGGIFAAFTVAFVPLWLLGYCPGLRDPLALVGGFALTAWFSFGFGMVLTGLSELNDAVHHFVGPVMYISLPLTGVFTMVAWLPARAQSIMLWSPLVNGSEMFRSGLFPAEIETHWSAGYLILCCLAVTSLGLALCRLAERRVEMP